MPLFVRRAVLCFLFAVGIPAVVFGQNYYAGNGEYNTANYMGDQVMPNVAINSSGGFLVWQDNATDGSGEGISAMQLKGGTLSTSSAFRVNQQGLDDQENPRVTLLKNGGAVFVWQGGRKGYQHIYARFLTSTNTFTTTGDVAVNTFTNNFQINPSVATLANGDIIIVWGSFDEVGSYSLQDVYGRIFSPDGTPKTGEFLINQFTTYNQRTPTVAALANGGFVVAWVSEQQRVVGVPNANAATPNQQAYPSADIYARTFDSNGSAQGNEFLVNTDSNPCANPDVAAASDNSFMVTWGARNMVNVTNSFDVYARSFTGASGSGSTVVRVNSYLYGDQYAPRISSLGTDYWIVWRSMGEDGSRSGVYGQFMRNNTSTVGGELRVNTTTVNEQIQPAVASDGVEQFIAVWSSYTGAPYSFDLFAQRYINTSVNLQAMPAPFVYAPFLLVTNKYQPQLQVSWAMVSGLAISNYEVYVDGSNSPMAITASNVWTMTAADGLTANSTHSFRVDYTMVDGRRSPLSPSASGTTWSGLNYHGIPFEWMEYYYGDDISDWPSNVNAPLATDGLNLLQIFMSGGNPLDSSTWLVTQLSNSPEGMFLSWNTQPGLTYQVQVTTDLKNWNDLGSPRFAAGTTDSINVGRGVGGYYRVILLRQ